nr:MAG TPA: hypothetical protein [Caudoviricetes sp.]
MTCTSPILWEKGTRHSGISGAVTMSAKEAAAPKNPRQRRCAGFIC